jgi:poly-beta-hydroxyalkanoate depolymerase
MPTTITPTVGRKVWFYEGNSPQDPMNRLDDKTPLDATVVYVHNPTCVNLRVTDHSGVSWSRNSVDLRDPTEYDGHGKNFYATWMPFQMGQVRVGTSKDVAAPEARAES